MQIPSLNDLSVLYHGTSSAFCSIDLSKCKPRKDFGCGFYTTTSYDQAADFARVKANRGLANEQTMYVMECHLEQSFELAHLETLVFMEPSVEWVEFVLANRYPNDFSSEHLASKLDIVIGPVADMKAGALFRALLDESYGDPHSMQAKQILVAVLQPQVLENQIVFLTDKAISCIKNRDNLHITSLGSVR